MFYLHLFIVLILFLVILMVAVMCGIEPTDSLKEVKRKLKRLGKE